MPPCDQPSEPGVHRSQEMPPVASTPTPELLEGGGDCPLGLSLLNCAQREVLECHILVANKNAIVSSPKNLTLRRQNSRKFPPRRREF